MKENFERALAAVLHHEGGFVNHPSDPGGMTNLGCTKKVWEEWVGHEVDEKAMRALTPADVAPLYKAKYWDKIKGDELPDGVDYVVFDCAINSGPGRAIKFLQSWTKNFFDKVVYRVDDASEILAAYMTLHGKPIPNSLKKGLALSLGKFNGYQLNLVS